MESEAGAEDVSALSREELIERVVALRRELGARPAAGPRGPPPAVKPAVKFVKAVKRKREFDFSKYAERQIALKISYDGRTYDGLARLDGNDNTVEGQLLVALEKTCLIRGRLECKLSKAGRTDKGVSSSGNVVAVLVRTNRPLGTSKGAPDVEEIDYATRLNAVLPSQIRVLRWAPVDERFSARFSAKHRVYRYFFLKGTLDLELMRQAASAFVGTHDFRNFCKADVEHVLSFERTLHSFGVSPVAGHFAQDAECCADPRLQLCAFTIKGRAFLWHQVRCMVAVLFLVGQGFESPEVVAKLLDIEAEPCKPQYALASDMPLVLHEIGYEPQPAWQGEGEAPQARLVASTLKAYGDAAIHQAFNQTLLGAITGMMPSEQWWPGSWHHPGGLEVTSNASLATGRPHRYVPLLQRARNHPLKLRSPTDATQTVARGRADACMVVGLVDDDDAGDE